MPEKMPRRLPDGSWEYPSLEKALEEAALFSISEYIARRQRTVAQYIALRTIYDIAVEEGRQRGTSTSMRWWEQPIDFAGALAELEEGENLVTMHTKLETEPRGAGGAARSWTGLALPLLIEHPPALWRSVKREKNILERL